MVGRNSHPLTRTGPLQRGHTRLWRAQTRDAHRSLGARRLLLRWNVGLDATVAGRREQREGHEQSGVLKHARESTEPVVTRRASQVILALRVRLSDQNLSDYLASVGLLERDEPVRVLGAGDGNINFVRRVQLGEARTLVVKQAREALERFPEYTVTTERIVFEHRYGEEVAARAPDVAGVLPRELLFDEDARTLVMEDLGEGPRLDLRLASGDVPLHVLPPA